MPVGNLFLCHYYEAAIGPFVNLSDLPLHDAERVLSEIRHKKTTFASKRSADYLKIRRDLEAKARKLFIAKGGRPIRVAPHYLTLGECSWLLDWYEKGQVLKIPLKDFDPYVISFTYGDLFPTMRYQDDKPYRRQVYTLEEIGQVTRLYGFPQEWNSEGNLGPERYIEVQLWDDSPIEGYRNCQKVGK